MGPPDLSVVADSDAWLGCVRKRAQPALESRKEDGSRERTTALVYGFWQVLSRMNVVAKREAGVYHVG